MEKSANIGYDRIATLPATIGEGLVQRWFLKIFKETFSPDYNCLEVISVKSPLLGHITPDI